MIGTARRERVSRRRRRAQAATVATAIPVLLLAGTGTALAHDGDWTGGVPLHDLIPAVIVAAVASAALVGLAVAHRRGRTRLLHRMSLLSETVSGTPGWAALPALVAGAALLTAVFGFYWDVAIHIDQGRDAGPFANPSHYPIMVGLAGVLLAGVLAVTLGTEDEHPTAVRIGRGWYAPIGGVLLLICGLFAVAGFPLDDIWHRIFGQDVTLWSPTHVQMVGGASLATIGLWVLYVEIQHSTRLRHDDPLRMRVFVRLPEIAMAGALLIGLSSLQAEFDYGLPQFRLVFQPIMIMLAAGIGLVVARIRLGRGGALYAALFFLALRLYLTVAIDSALGRSVLHAPLYLPEAVLVELVALRVPRDRQLTLAAWSGVAIGTVGLAVEWAWSHVWMPVPWPATLLPEALALAIPAALAGALLGGFIGRAMTPPGVARQPAPPALAALAGIVALVVMAVPMPRQGLDGVRAEIALEEVTGSPQRTAHATVRIIPAEAAADADWLTVTAWQGAGRGQDGSFLDHLEPAGPGVWRTTQPVPVYGEWKAMVRLHRGPVLAGAPIYLPPDPAVSFDGEPFAGLPAEQDMVRPFVADTTLLLLEARDAPMWLSAVAYLVLAGIGVAWIAAIVWGLARLQRRTAAAAGHRGGTADGALSPAAPRRHQPEPVAVAPSGEAPQVRTAAPWRAAGDTRAP